MAIIACPRCGAKNRVDEARAEQLQPVCGRCGRRLEVGTTGGAGSNSGARAGSDRPIEVTDETFAAEVLGAGSVPVLVDCWAPWCGPCRRIAPILDQLAAESGGRYVIAKLNTDENPGVAGQFRIDAIPTLLVFKDGRLVDRIVGLASKDVIAQKLAAHA